MYMNRPLVVSAVLALALAACSSGNPTPSPAAPSVAPPSATLPSAVPTLTPATEPPPSVPASVAPSIPEGLTPCRPTDLTISVSWADAGGPVAGTVKVTNAASGQCGLQGAPTAIGIRSGGGTLPTDYEPHPWVQDDATQAVAPPVVLEPGASASAGVRWTNWCLGPATIDTVWVGIPQSPDQVDVHPEPTLPVPTCTTQGGASTVSGFAFALDGAG